MSSFSLSSVEETGAKTGVTVTDRGHSQGRAGDGIEAAFSFSLKYLLFFVSLQRLLILKET